MENDTIAADQTFARRLKSMQHRPKFFNGM